MRTAHSDPSLAHAAHRPEPLYIGPNRRPSYEAEVKGNLIAPIPDCSYTLSRSTISKFITIGYGDQAGMAGLLPRSVPPRMPMIWIFS